MTDKLFVYGTLAPGESNEHMLADVSGTWEPAKVKGKLFKNGWGLTLGYPAIVLDSLGDDVEGLIFSSGELSEHWARLDEFEGVGYQRVITSAMRADGSLIEAYVYQLNREIDHQ